MGWVLPVISQKKAGESAHFPFGASLFSNSTFGFLPEAERLGTQHDIAKNLFLLV
jgi:hypothetical protein